MHTRRQFLTASLVALSATSVAADTIPRAWDSSDIPRAWTADDIPKAELSGDSGQLAKVPSSRRVVIFSTSWCQGCKVFHRDEEPLLLAAGWRYGVHLVHETDATDKERFDRLCDQYGIKMIPSLVLVEDGFEPVVIQASAERSITRHDVTGLYLRPPKRNRVRAVATVRKSRIVQPYPSTFHPPEWTEGSGTVNGMVSHLAGWHGFSGRWVKSLSWGQLVALHSDVHNSRVRWEFVQRG